MTGIDRSNLSYRTIFILLILLVAPTAARSAALEDSARELARKIAASLPARDVTRLPPRDDVFIEMRNLSSLLPEELVRTDQALRAELQRCGIGAPESSGETARVLVTLSENLKDYVWTAEIRQGDALQVVLTTTPRSLDNRIVSNAMAMTLHSEKLWEGPEHIVDVSFVVLSNSEQRMVLLVPGGLIITSAEKGSTFKRVEFPPAESVDREPIGDLKQVGNSAESWLNGRVCTAALDTGTLVRCYVPSTPEVATVAVPKGSDQVRELVSNCGISNPVLAAGTGDYTQSDSVRVFKGKTAISNELSFPGPVLRFSQGLDTQFVSAITHNLNDGNYEVYRLSISCGQ